MKRLNKGFGLIEMLIALALSLVVVLGVAQIFIAAKNTYVSQNAAAPNRPTLRINNATRTSISVMPSCARLLHPLIRSFHPIEFVRSNTHSVSCFAPPVRS